LHTARHFFASWCINRKSERGLGLSLQQVQERMGHSTPLLVLTRYGHLFPKSNNAEELAEAEKALLG
jgi:integrase